MALIDCIDQVCEQAEKTTEAIAEINGRLTDYDRMARENQEAAAKQVQALLSQSARAVGVFDCVLTKPEGHFCQAGSMQHISLAEALARLNALSITGMQQGAVTASAGATETTIGAAPATPAALNVWLNGAEMVDPTDYTVAGTTITWVYPLAAGDVVDWTVFTV